MGSPTTCPCGGEAEYLITGGMRLGAEADPWSASRPFSFSVTGRGRSRMDVPRSSLLSQVDGAAVQHRDMLDDGQPQSGAARRLGTTLVHPVEPFEHPALRFLRMPMPVSLTVSTALPLSRRTLTWTSLFVRLYLMPFSMRLSSTSRSAAREERRFHRLPATWMVHVPLLRLGRQERVASRAAGSIGVYLAWGITADSSPISGYH